MTLFPNGSWHESRGSCACRAWQLSEGTRVAGWLARRDDLQRRAPRDRAAAPLLKIAVTELLGGLRDHVQPRVHPEHV